MKKLLLASVMFLTACQPPISEMENRFSQGLMRINPKAYDIVSDSTPIDVQEFDSRVIKVYYMNEFQALMDEFINKCVSLCHTWENEIRLTSIALFELNKNGYLEVNINE